MSYPPFPFGTGGDLRFAPNRGRTPDSRARAGIRYPSPFFDIGHTYLPPNLKSLLRWCRFYFYTQPIVNTAVTKMAAYPITDLHYDTESEGLQYKWDDFLMRQLGLRSFLYAVGLDYFAYGNAFVGISFALRKNLICKHCGARYYIGDIEYKFRDFKYEAKCLSCGTHAPMGVFDHYTRTPDGVQLMRWNPEDIDIDYNPYTGKKRILYTLPIQMRNDIRLGKRSVIEEVPDIYIQAVAKNKPMRLNRVYHFARSSLAQDIRNMGWGISMILPIMKTAYYMAMLQKAQEVIAQEHIVPLRILFPQAGSGTSDPYSTINLQDWVGKLTAELDQWKLDQNHIPIMPVPVGNQTLGGDGRALLLAQELRMLEEEIIAGMGVPVEFVKGGVSYSGTSLSMHILKNQFETYRRFVLEMIQDFIIRECARHLQWPTVKIRLKRFHMADDLQRAALTLQLNQAAKVSNKTMLSELNYDSGEEMRIIKQESAIELQNMAYQQLQQAHMQGEAGKVQMRYQTSAMQEQQPAPLPEQMPPQPMEAPLGEMPAPGQPEQIDKHQLAAQIAHQLTRPEVTEEQLYANLKALAPYPEIHTLVTQRLNEMRGRPNSAPKPLPEQKPPRRGPAQAVM